MEIWMAYQIQLREVEAQPILGIRAVVPTLELDQFFDEASREMQTYLEQQGIRSTGPAMSLWRAMQGPPRSGSE